MNWSSDYTELMKEDKKPMAKKLKTAQEHFAQLVAKAKRQELTAASYARASLLPYATCWRILKGKVTRPTMAQIVSLASALNIDVEIKLVPR